MEETTDLRQVTDETVHTYGTSPNTDTPKSWPLPKFSNIRFVDLHNIIFEYTNLTIQIFGRYENIEHII